jgi:hypothetical protein
MSERSGPFWDSVEGRIPLPRAAATLGFELVAADPELFDPNDEAVAAGSATARVTQLSG